MAFIHNSSPECLIGKMDLFQVPATQVSVEGTETIEYKPTNALDFDSPIEFRVPGSADDYLDLDKTNMIVKVCIVKNDGSRLSDGENVSCVNNLLHSLFSEIIVTLNGQVLSSPSHLYPYRAFFQNLFNYNETAKNTHIGLSLWSTDTASQMEDTTGENFGYEQRKKYFLSSMPVAMMGRLTVNIFGQSKYLLNGVSVGVNLIPSKNSFCLIAGNDSHYRVKILEAVLQITRVKVTPSLLIAHNKVLSTNASAKYPISRVDMKQYTISSGLMSVSLDNLVTGQLPIRVIIGLTLNSAANGHFKENPFNFQHFNMNFISLTKDGVPVHTKPIQPSFDAANTDYVRSYHSTFSGTNICDSDDGWQVDKDSYCDGYVLHAFDLSPTKNANSNVWHLRKYGVLALELRFSSALTKTITCIVFSEYQNLIQIDRDRRVTLDY